MDTGILLCWDVDYFQIWDSMNSAAVIVSVCVSLGVCSQVNLLGGRARCTCKFSRKNAQLFSHPSRRWDSSLFYPCQWLNFCCLVSISSVWFFIYSSLIIVWLNIFLFKSPFYPMKCLYDFYFFSIYLFLTNCRDILYILDTNFCWSCVLA